MKWDGATYSDVVVNAVVYVFSDVVTVKVCDRKCQGCGTFIYYDGRGDHLTCLGTTQKGTRVLLNNMDLFSMISHTVSSSDSFSLKIAWLVEHICPTKLASLDLLNRDAFMKGYWSLLFNCADLRTPTDMQHKCTGNVVVADGVALGCRMEGTLNHFSRSAVQKDPMMVIIGSTTSQLASLSSSSSSASSSATSVAELGTEMDIDTDHGTKYLLYRQGMEYGHLVYISGNVRKYLFAFLWNKDPNDKRTKPGPFTQQNREEMYALMNFQQYDVDFSLRYAPNADGKIYSFLSVIGYVNEARQFSRPIGEHTLRFITSATAHNLGALTCTLGPMVLLWTYARLAHGGTLDTFVPVFLLCIPDMTNVLFEAARAIVDSEDTDLVSTF